MKRNIQQDLANSFPTPQGMQDIFHETYPKAIMVKCCITRKINTMLDLLLIDLKMRTSQASCVTVNAFTVINFDSKNKKNALSRYRQMDPGST